MSVQAMSWVFDFSESRLGARLVLLAIANHVSNDTGESWPSIETISKEARVDETNVRRNIAELVRLGELEVESGGRGPRDTNTYRMTAFMEWYGRGAKGGDLRGAKGGDLHSKGGDLPEKGVQSAPRTITNHQEPSSLQPSRSSEEEETPPSKEREDPQGAYRSAKARYRSICKKNLGNLGERHGEAWASLIGQYGEKVVIAALEIWAREIRDPKRLDYPIAVFLKNADEYIEAYGIENDPQNEKSEDGEDRMLTAKDIMRERERRG